MSPEPYYTDDLVTLHLRDCLDVMVGLPDASVDAVVTDPPYGLEFMGKEWDGADGFRRSLNANDAGRGNVFGRSSRTSPEYRAGSTFQQWCEAWAGECLRVLRPGGHLLAFGGSRTWHRLAAAVEDAGFEIRDSIAWLYGSGFPKSLNLGDGRGTALKPAFEPIVVGRKPLAGTVAANVERYSTGALNIDACRTGVGLPVPGGGGFKGGATTRHEGWTRPSHEAGYATEEHTAGRWPTNVVLDDTQAAELDRQSGPLHTQDPSTRRGTSNAQGVTEFRAGNAPCYDDPKGSGASRFFPIFRYEAKAPTAERPRGDDGTAHPTVKPLDLMRWLVRLVTPPGGVVLEPFLGSGTTAEACVVEGFRCIGIEREEAYMRLAVARLSKPIEPVLDFGVSA